MTDINREIEAIMSRGFSREQSVKIFFANRTDLHHDPSAPYNFDRTASLGASASESDDDYAQVSIRPVNNNGRSFMQPRSLGTPQTSPNGHPQAEQAHSPTPQPQSISPNGSSRYTPPLAAVQSSTVASSNVAQTNQATTATRQQITIEAALSESLDDNDAPAPPPRTLARMASNASMVLTDEDEAQIQILIGQGYPRVVATQMYRQKGKLGGLNKSVLQSNANLNDLLTPGGHAVHQPNEHITLADFGIEEIAPAPASSRRPTLGEPQYSTNSFSGQYSPATAQLPPSGGGGGGGSTKYPTHERRPSYTDQLQYAQPPLAPLPSQGQSQRLNGRTPSNADMREYAPPPAPEQQQLSRHNSFRQQPSPQETESEVQVLMHQGYSRNAASDIVLQRRESNANMDYNQGQSQRGVERKRSDLSLQRAAIENSYNSELSRGMSEYEQRQAQQSTPRGATDFQKPVTRKSSSGTLSQGGAQEDEEDLRQIELMISRGYTEEQARRATALRREHQLGGGGGGGGGEGSSRHVRQGSNAGMVRIPSNSNVFEQREPTPTGHVRRSSFTGSDSGHIRHSSFSGNDSPAVRKNSLTGEQLTFEEQAEFNECIRRGYTDEQAMTVVRQNRGRGQLQQQQNNGQSFYSQGSSQHLQHHQSSHHLESHRSQHHIQSQFSQSQYGNSSPEPPRRDNGNTRAMLQRTGSITVPPDNLSRSNSGSNVLSGVNADDEALRVGLLVSEQDAEFGVNMYQTITVDDEPEILRLINMGYNTDDAVYLIFQRTYRSRNPNPYVPVPMANRNSPAPPRRESQSPVPEHKSKGLFHRPSFLKNLGGKKESNSDMRHREHRDHRDHRDYDNHRDYDHGQSPHRSGSQRSMHHQNSHYEDSHHHNGNGHGQSQYQQRYHDYQESPEEREMRLKLRYNQVDVDRLTELSFTREQAIQALVENHNNYERALTMLLRS